MTDPIRPDDVAGMKGKMIPDAVIEAFNEIIAQHYYNGTATFKQQDIVARIVQKGIKRDDIFTNHWLDIEPIYRAAGWKIFYDKPGYNETYEPTFTFTRRKNV